jgi:membrane-associated protease RseP (regulator of RpoE activity)
MRDTPEHGGDSSGPFGHVPTGSESLARGLQPRRRWQTPGRRRVVLPAALFLATCASTFWTGVTDWMPILHMGSLEHVERMIAAHWSQGLIYMAAVLGILLTHEMGHFLAALYHRVPASLPYFIPVPFLPFGTMGAVISMEGHQADRRQMFDLGLAGPLAGLVVAVPVSIVGVMQLGEPSGAEVGIQFHNPLLFRLLIGWLHPGSPAQDALVIEQLNPLLMAGWVGMLVTGLNMLPVSQLDGGHVAYALFGRGAHWLARAFLISAIAFVVVFEQYGWVLMVVLVTLLGTDHPPTANDRVALGWPRRILGWLALPIPVLCFPPLGISEVL